jgi:T4 RnlA family RNA ligase
MNYEQQTYKNLMTLIENNDAFFFKDFTLDDKVYRIMNYRLASWTLFQEPSSLDCRGIMFDVTNQENVKLVSLPPEKFFNYEEGGVDHTKGTLGDKMVKMDGSLISTYIHNDQLYLKSKGSLFSSQALDAMKFLDKDENAQLKKELEKLAKSGFTVNLEYTSPENRVVIPYQTEELTVLSARRHEDGRNFFATKLIELLDKNHMNATIAEMVHHESLHGKQIDQLKFVDDVRAEQEGEGYVVEIVLPDGSSYLSKIKNIRYIALHHTKDSVNSAKHLFEAVIEEATDDLRSMFADDQYVLNKVEEMERHVQPIFNNIIKTVEEFHAANKELVRKDYAIKAKSEQPELMSLIMNSYLGQENDYKEFAKKRRKEMFGIGEDPVVDEEDTPSTRLKAA